MGNANHSGTHDPGTAMKGWPILFHSTHSDNVELSLDRKRANRIESFCKGICFSNRAIGVCERVHIKLTEVSVSWSGVMRFGFTSNDPAKINGSVLPRYACPDLTNRSGFWAKALPERYSVQENVVSFYFARSGDVMYGINGEEKGLFLSGVTASFPLWALVDIYGNSTSMEFVDGIHQQAAEDPATFSEDLAANLGHMSLVPPQLVVPALAITQTPGGALIGANSPVRFHLPELLAPVSLHPNCGRNIAISMNGLVATRHVEEYCNGYVFLDKPLGCEQKLVIQLLAIDRDFSGSLAFGMTSCNPCNVAQAELPDDSDLLLDRLEYWVVNKDVCPNVEVGDELSFHLTEEGEVRFARNNRPVAVLMFVDKTLPLWPFLDVYGNTQKIKLLGIIDENMSNMLSAALPSSARSGSPSSGRSVSPIVPPRPPPPKTPSTSPLRSPPILPPKQKTGPLPPPLPKPGTLLTPTLAPPVPVRPPSVAQLSSMLPSSLAEPSASLPPMLPPRVASSVDGRGEKSDYIGRSESDDNVANECSFCMDKQPDCVLYTCGHMCLCHDCAMHITKHGNRLCPICRQEIKDVIKIFRS